MNVNDKVVLGGTETTVVGKVARGKFFRYEFADGRTFHGDPEALKAKGQLEILDREITATFEPIISDAPDLHLDDNDIDDEHGELVGT